MARLDRILKLLQERGGPGGLGRLVTNNYRKRDVAIHIGRSHSCQALCGFEPDATTPGFAYLTVADLQQERRAERLCKRCIAIYENQKGENRAPANGNSFDKRPAAKKHIQQEPESVYSSAQKIRNQYRDWPFGHVQDHRIFHLRQADGSAVCGTPITQGTIPDRKPIMPEFCRHCMIKAGMGASPTIGNREDEEFRRRVENESLRDGTVWEEMSLNRHW